MTELSLPRRILIDEDAGSALGTLLEYYNINSILLVTDKVIANKDFFKEILSLIDREDLKIRIFSNVNPEPSISDVIEVYQDYRDSYDAIIAVGGGSVIDFSKSLSILIKKGGEFDLRGVAPFQSLGIEFTKPLLIAIPTTCGTGSDASYGIVLTDTLDNILVKLALGNYELVPHITILDAKLALELPINLKIGTALDALSHAVESLVAIDSNEFTRPYSEHTIRYIFKYLPRIVDNPQDLESLKKIMYAATMAGIAFTNAGLGLAHAIAHQLGAGLHIHHGTIVGMTLPYVVKFNYRSPTAREMYEGIRKIITLIDDIKLGNNFYEDIIDLYDRIGFPNSLVKLSREYHISSDAINKYADMALHDPEIVYNPVPPRYEDIRMIIKALVEGDINIIT